MNRTSRRFHFAEFVSVAVILSLATLTRTARAQIDNSLPRSRDRGSAASAQVTARKIDDLLQAAWKQNGIQAAPTADDARFLRRAYLDIIGRLPPPERIVAFLADKTPDKRSRMIDELLDSDGYAEHWATYWDAILLGRLTAEGFIDRVAFKRWLVGEFRHNRPWDEFATALVTADGYNTNVRPKGAVSDPHDFDQRFAPETNWFLRYSRSLPELSGATAKVFLGVQIQCAQCHDHKTEKWTQKDFQQFTALFAKTWPVYQDRDRLLRLVGIFRVETKERLIAPPTRGKAAQYFGSYHDYVRVKPKLLDGAEISSFGKRRDKLARWMTAEENPWFAKAISNRMWGRLLGTGFVEPIDDFRSSNPATMPQALETLASDFIAHGFDVKHLLRVILNTQAYQRASQNLEQSPDSHTLWAGYPLKPLDIEVLFDIILQSTDSTAYLDRIANGNLQLVKRSFVRQFVMQMSTDDMAEVTDSEESIARALMQLNGALINGTTRATPGLGLSKTLRTADTDRQRITELYLHTLSRPASAEETQYWLTFLDETLTLVRTEGPPTNVVRGPAALRVSDRIDKAGKNADFRELMEQAKTGADFKAIAGMMKNNADAGLYVRAFERFAAEVPFQLLAGLRGAKTAKEQAYEDFYWALINSSEFLTIH